MKTACRIGAAMIAWLGAASSVPAQEVQWKQTLNIPLGQNISRDRADMLGIEFGDTYTEAKAKLEKLAAEGIQPKKPSGSYADRMRMELRMQAAGAAPSLSLREEQRVFQFQVPGQAKMVTASYIAKIKLDRQLPGTGERPVREYITVHFSGPSSGHQVVGMERFIDYAQVDQPRISDVLAQLKAKFKADPQVHFGTEYTYQFNDGQPFVPPVEPILRCLPALNAIESLDGIRNLNKDGTCDVVLLLKVNPGVSQDHATSLTFSFADNARIRANGGADYAFVESYIASMQKEIRGAPPKL